MNKKSTEKKNKIDEHLLDEWDYTPTPLDEAYDLLEEAENAKTEPQAKKLARQAYEHCPECFDALLFLLEFEKSFAKKEELLDEGLAREKERLKKESLFNKDCIGHFYGLFETRPYMRGLFTKANMQVFTGKFRQATLTCKEILRLNENDNLGARYLLMALYAVLEEEKEILELYKKYEEADVEMIFPLFVLNYKKGDQKKTKKYFDLVKQYNKHLINILKEDNFKILTNELEQDYYSRGDISEAKMYISNYSFLIISTPGIFEYVMENDRPSKNQRRK